MKFVKIFCLALVTVTFALQHAAAQEQKDGLTWYTDVKQVYDVSTKTKKPVFAFFTGSDWCGWCHRLQANVFSKQGFKDWAKKNVILLELDFPRNKKLPDALVKQNDDLQRFFNVQGFPTIWMFNMTKDKKTDKFSIAALGSLGYPSCEPGKEETTFLANATQVLNNKK
ncbi:MAG: thioredoxin family protein [Bacteroidetes bacterium]|nr:thioredoxin family protein [Bacteroidota bacterium]